MLKFDRGLRLNSQDLRKIKRLVILFEEGNDFGLYMLTLKDRKVYLWDNENLTPKGVINLDEIGFIEIKVGRKEVTYAAEDKTKS